MNEDNSQTNLKPEKNVFVYYKLFTFALSSLIIALLVWLFSGLNVFLLFIIWLILVSSSFVSLHFRYTKENYNLQSTRFVRRGGGIFSDNETELNIKNITQVSMQLPFIEHRLFGTGSIVVQSAGSANAEITLSHLSDPQATYDHVQSMMKSNGFELNKEKLIQSEKPSKLAALFETFGIISGALVGWFYFLAIFLQQLLSLPTGLIVLGIALGTMGLIAVMSLRYLDLSKRHYIIYNDTLIYQEGFLSKLYSFIPVENLADSNLTQSLVDKIFNLYDIRISCQGSGQEILFKNVKNGEQMETNIDRLISQASSIVNKSTTGTAHNAQQSIASKATATVQSTQSQAHFDSAFTAEYRMDTTRTLMPILFFLPLFIPLFFFIPFLIIPLITIIIQISATRFIVRPNAVEQRYNFLAQRNVEFSNDKITSVVFKENFIDSWLGTCTVIFRSIGSGQSISFKNIKKHENIYQSLLAKTGIVQKKPIYKMNSQFSFGAFLLANLPSNTVLLLLVLSSVGFGLATDRLNMALWWLLPVLIIYGIVIVHKYIHYKRSRLTVFNDSLHFHKGVLFRKDHYARLDNIKDISTLRFPLSEKGNVTFNIAGDGPLANQYKQQNASGYGLSGTQSPKSLSNNGFKINYIANIKTKDDLIDLIFYKRPSLTELEQILQNIADYIQEPIITTKPDLRNTLWPLMIVSVVFLPLLPFTLIALPFVVWSIRAKSYIIEPYRVISRSGRIYKHQSSIVLSKIDHINKERGLLNKIFKNGKIIINTVGSSKAEMVLDNVRDFDQFYDALKDRY